MIPIDIFSKALSSFSALNCRPLSAQACPAPNAPNASRVLPSSSAQNSRPQVKLAGLLHFRSPAQLSPYLPKLCPSSSLLNCWPPLSAQACLAPNALKASRVPPSAQNRWPSSSQACRLPPDQIHQLLSTLARRSLIWQSAGISIKPGSQVKPRKGS
ncbi:hypothetical protein Q8A67_022840 [Cirrhinus molitorella]|uniref:Uncharacterized protein n=1 Tax=Cirrhinus molitorella TaxID=172907 RepID=A0AA88TDT7_9TELE|nr:hypothetical protein Q8A67_022840 [Cirrhinus molitorella]